MPGARKGPPTWGRYAGGPRCTRTGDPGTRVKVVEGIAKVKLGRTRPLQKADFKLTHYPNPPARYTGRGRSLGMLRFRLRTLLTLLAIMPQLLAGGYWGWRAWHRVRPRVEADWHCPAQLSRFD